MRLRVLKIVVYIQRMGGAPCGSLPKRDGKRRVGDEIGPVVDEKLHDAGVPGEQHVSKRDGFDIRPKRNEQFN
jgi:hypothetical protein